MSEPLKKYQAEICISNDTASGLYTLEDHEVYIAADVERVFKPLLDWIVIDEFASDEMKRDAQRLLASLKEG